MALRTALARSGTPLINIEAVTPTGLARHVWRAVRPEEGHRFIGRPAAEYVLGALAGQQASPETRLLQSSVATVFDSIQSDKDVGRTSEELFRHASTPFQEAYAQLFDQYQTYLGSTMRLDDSDVRLLASGLIDQFALQRHVGLVALIDMVDLSESERALISTLGEKSFRHFLIGASNKKSVDMSSWDYPVLEGGRSVAQEQPTPNTGQSSAPPHERVEAAVHVIQAGTRREEVRSVLADILKGGISLDRIELAYTDGSAYLCEITSACERFGIPWQTTSPLKNEDHRLIELLRSYAEWIQSGFETGILVRMLRSQLLSVSSLEEHPGDIATALEAFPIGLEKLNDPAVWAIIEEKASGRSIGKAQLLALRTFSRPFNSFVLPQRLSFLNFKNHFIRLVADFGGAYTDPVGATDFLASNYSFGAALDVMESDGTWIAKRVIQGLPRTRSMHASGIWILPVRDAGYGSAQKVYLLGLDDQATSDAEVRPRVDSPLIPLGTGRVEEERRETVSIRMVVKELHRKYASDLVLSLPSYDVAAGRPLFPSSALIELTGITKISPKPRTQWLDQADRMAGSRDSNVYQEFPALGFGRHAQLKRASSAWSEFDGVLAISEGWRLASASPSKLEVLASCPYRYFLSSVLRLNVPEPQAEAWITSREEGTLLHKLFEEHTRNRLKPYNSVEPLNRSLASPSSELLNRLDPSTHSEPLKPSEPPRTSEPPRPLAESDAVLMKERLEEELSMFVQLAEGSAEAVLARKQKELGDSITLYLRHEFENEGVYRPVAVEYSFGNFPDSDAKPCIVPLSAGPMALSGRLDRLDMTDSGTYVITDYKTGNFKGYAAKDLRQLTDHLQWAFYSLMVENSTHSPVELFEYFFPSKKGAGLKRQVAAPAKEQVIEVLEDLSSRFNRGTFVQAAGDSACVYCDFRNVCGDLTQRKNELTSKFLDPSDTLTPIFHNWNYRTKMKGDL